MATSSGAGCIDRGRGARAGVDAAERQPAVALAVHVHASSRPSAGGQDGAHAGRVLVDERRRASSVPCRRSQKRALARQQRRRAPARPTASGANTERMPKRRSPTAAKTSADDHQQRGSVPVVPSQVERDAGRRAGCPPRSPRCSRPAAGRPCGRWCAGRRAPRAAGPGTTRPMSTVGGPKSADGRKTYRRQNCCGLGHVLPRLNQPLSASSAQYQRVAGVSAGRKAQQRTWRCPRTRAAAHCREERRSGSRRRATSGAPARQPDGRAQQVEREHVPKVNAVDFTAMSSTRNQRISRASAQKPDRRVEAEPEGEAMARGPARHRPRVLRRLARGRRRAQQEAAGSQRRAAPASTFAAAAATRTAPRMPKRRMSTQGVSARARRPRRAG